MEPPKDMPNDIIGWIVYAVGIAVAIWYNGRAVGKVESSMQTDLAVLRKDHDDIEAEVSALKQIDWVGGDELRKIYDKDYLTRAELEKEQSVCRRERGYELERIQERADSKIAIILAGQEHIQNALNDYTQTHRVVCDEIRILRESLLKNGLDIKHKERIGDA